MNFNSQEIKDQIAAAKVRYENNLNDPEFLKDQLKEEDRLYELLSLVEDRARDWERENPVDRDLMMKEGMDYFENYQNKKYSSIPENAEYEAAILSLRMQKVHTRLRKPEGGDIFSLERFVACCEAGGFIDYDGFGNYIYGDLETDIEVYPSDIKKGLLRLEFDGVNWYNR